MSDLIERQAAIDAVRSYMADNDIEDSDWHADGIVYEIKRLPTVETKTGKWISDGQKQKHGYEWMHCSVCGFSDIDDPATHTNYCPNCGAKMEGEDNGVCK